MIVQRICDECGNYYGNREDSWAMCPQVATYHLGVCDVCEEEKPVTEPRDFGLSSYFFLEKMPPEELE